MGKAFYIEGPAWAKAMCLERPVNLRGLKITEWGGGKDKLKLARQTEARSHSDPVGSVQRILTQVSINPTPASRNTIIRPRGSQKIAEILIKWSYPYYLGLPRGITDVLFMHTLWAVFPTTGAT